MLRCYGHDCDLLCCSVADRGHKSEVRAHMHTERAQTHTGNTTSTTTAEACNQDGFSCFYLLRLRELRRAVGGGGRNGRGGRGEEMGGRGGSMHLCRTAGKGHLSLHGSAPAVCSLLLRPFMSTHGDSVRRRGRRGGGKGGAGWGVLSHPEEEDEVGGRKAIEGIALLMLHSES